MFQDTVYELNLIHFFFILMCEMCGPPLPFFFGGGGVLFCACTSINVHVNNFEEERVENMFYSQFIEFIGKAGTK